VEVKEVFFDERSLNWHALAVLDRTRAGAGASEAVAQRLARGRAVLDGLGQGPIADFMALRQLTQLSSELDRLAVALAMFAPSRKAAAKGQIESLQSDIVKQRMGVQSRATVRVVMHSSAPGALPDVLAEEARQALKEAGFTVVSVGAAGELQVDVEVNTATQVGAMRIYEVTSGAAFKLVEQDRTVAAGTIPIDRSSASRSGAEHLSRGRSLNRLADRLRMGITAMLNSEES